MLCALCCVPAHALEYSFDAPEDYLFGQPTSDDTIYEWENPNVDRSKNTSLIAPGFGTPTSYLPGSGEYLTPNLVPGALSGGLVNQVGSAGANATGGVAGSSVIPGQYPSVGGNVTMTQVPGSNPTDIAQGNTTGGYTEVTDNLYYSNGSLGTLKIPAIDLTVKVYQGTDSAALKKGAGHFTNTSIWDGNVALAGHNRGVRNDFGKLHTLSVGDAVTLTTMLGTRTYAVTSVEKVSVNDSSGTASTTDNRVTLYTCVMDQPEYRWCITAIQQG
ncbi:class D sortase [bacterium 1xD42-67]|nr:class D sortase [bacterium 1xD42-67]